MRHGRTGLSALRAAVEAELAGVSLRALEQAAAGLSRRYRAGGRAATHAPAANERLAYIATRMPATAAALAVVLAETDRVLASAPATLLDLGSGPGTSLWPALDIWPSLTRATLVDRDAGMLEIGQRLWTRRDSPSSLEIEWRNAPLTGSDPLPSHDLVLLSYTIGELEARERETLCDRARAAARHAVIVVEPGTPAGYARVLDVRAQGIVAGLHVLAPCPHDAGCPLAPLNDWCHFAARVERSRAHRLIKGGALGWEDEKFSYVVLSTHAPDRRARARILRHPIKGSGHVNLRLCAADGLRDVTVGRRSDEYRVARRAEWGDRWPDADTSQEGPDHRSLE
ncbi:MAG TPA: small ribosomal subunit Rsm22 family protein [Vicinamibacterales bacterium]